MCHADVLCSTPFWGGFATVPQNSVTQITPHTQALAQPNRIGNIMEIYTLEISFPYDEEDEPWVRTIEVREYFTLGQLHEYIQEIVEFDDDHLYEFFIGQNPRNKSNSVPSNVKLNEIYPITGYNIYYLFDFGDSWLFQIKKLRKRLNEESGLEYPRIIKSSGKNPEQYPEYEE